MVPRSHYDFASNLLRIFCLIATDAWRLPKRTSQCDNPIAHQHLLRIAQMDSSKIEQVTISAVNGILSCTITFSNISEFDPQFAFYIYRNQERVHVEWYSSDCTFDYDTNGLPGCYWVSGFATFGKERKDKVNSKKIFLNPLEVTTDQFPAADENACYYLLKSNSWNFPALYYPNEAKSLFVLLPSAVDRQKSSLPAFHRWTWADSGFFPGNVLCISDPTLTLHEDLKLGWMLGNKDSCATSELSEFITEFAKAKGIPHDKIVIYGSSAGGFAALAMAAHIEGSVAVAVNPQIDATSYVFTAQVDLVCKTCFGMSKEDVHQQFEKRVDMTRRWEDVKYSKAFIVQNTTDTHHYIKHYTPFWRALGGNPEAAGVSYAGRHLAWLYTAEGGHGPETKDMANEIITLLDL